MAVPKKLTVAFLIIYIAVLLYILLFFFVPPIQEAVISLRENLASLTQGDNYYWALLISLIICFLGSASIAFPVPFPFVLFSLSLSVMGNFGPASIAIQSPTFWFQIMGLAIIGGLGCAIGELSGYIVGYSAKKIANGTHSNLLENIDGFGKLILENEKRTPLYIFLFALTPLPDDIIFLPLGMIKYPPWKCIIPGWLGKTVTTIVYCVWPVLFALGFTGGYSDGHISSIITESIMMIITITVMFFIMSFDWNKYFDNRKKNLKKNE